MAKEKTPSWVLPPSSDEAPPPPSEPDFIDTLAEYAGVGNRALAPYLTAATLGAAAGAPFAGVGAAPGAALGVVGLGIGDLSAGTYNLVAPAFGGGRIPTPSENIQNAFSTIGIGRKPTTPSQQVFSDVLQAGAGGLSQTLGARTLAPMMSSPRAQNIMRMLGENARAQTGAAVGGAAAPSVAANYFDVTNPYALFGLSLAGSMAGGGAASPRVAMPTVDELRTAANAAYTSMRQAGVRVSQPALSQLNADINTNLRNLDFIPGSHPEVRRRLAQIQQEFRGPMDLSRLDSLHSDIAAAARKAPNSKTRMYMEEIAHNLDDFLRSVTPGQTVGGNTRAATDALSQARQLWRDRSQLSLLDDAAEAAQNAAQQGKKNFGAALRSEYQKILGNRRVFDRLSPEVQDAVRMVANGTPTSRGLDVIARLAPTNRSAIAGELLAASGMYAASQHAPLSVGLPIAAATAGGMAKTAANRMAISQAQRARATAAGVAPQRPIYRGPMALPAAQQAVQAPQRGSTAQQRRDIYNLPWWAVPTQ